MKPLRNNDRDKLALELAEANAEIERLKRGYNKMIGSFDAMEDRFRDADRRAYEANVALARVKELHRRWAVESQVIALYESPRTACTVRVMVARLGTAIAPRQEQ